MLRYRVLSAALVATAAASAASAASATVSPSLRAHSIFGAGPGFHVGSLVEVDASHKTLTMVCADPAPIDRPACSPGKVFAPSAPGTTKITATFSDGATAELPITVGKAAGKYDGGAAVPGVATCAPTTLYGNYDRRHHRLVGKHGTAAKSVRVALYNRVGTGRFTWVYSSNANGFAEGSCTTPKPLN